MDVNSIQVKNEVYDIADKHYRDLYSSITTDQPTLITPSLDARIPFSENEKINVCRLQTVFDTVHGFAICDTEGNNSSKVVTIENITTLVPCVTKVFIKFTNANTANDITLTINNQWSYPILASDGYTQLQTGSIAAGTMLELTFVDQKWISNTPLVKRVNGEPVFVWDI